MPLPAQPNGQDMERVRLPVAELYVYCVVGQVFVLVHYFVTDATCQPVSACKASPAYYTLARSLLVCD